MEHTCQRKPCILKAPGSPSFCQPNLERWTGSYMHLKGLLPEPGMFTYAAETLASLWPGALYTNSHLLLRWTIPWWSVNTSTMDSLLALLTALLCPKHCLIPLPISLLCLSVEKEQVSKEKQPFSLYSQASCSPALLEHTQTVLRETKGRPGWILHCPQSQWPWWPSSSGLSPSEAFQATP